MFGDIFGGVLSLVFVLALYGLPLLILAWIVRTFALMRRDQQRLLTLVESIEAEVRAHGDRQRWGKP
jgi:hypothetical protein